MFLTIGTQWRHSFSGPAGLDYSVLFPLLAIYDITDKRNLFEGIRVMEHAALEYWSKGAENVTND